MIRIAVTGDIGSGKSYIARLFGYPVFNADHEVAILYKKSKKCFYKLKKKLPKYITSFPVDKEELTKAIIDNGRNLKKIITIIHPEIRLKMFQFIKKNKNQKIIVLDIPLLLEKKLNKKNDVIIFIRAKKKEIDKRIKKRNNYNEKIIRKFKKLQLPVELKKKKADYIINNNFRVNDVKKSVKNILKKILFYA